MKVELIQRTEITGITKFWVYVDDQPKDCFSSELDAVNYYNSITSEKPVDLVLLTKEV